MQKNALIPVAGGATKINIPPSAPRRISWFLRHSAYANIAAAPHVHLDDPSPSSPASDTTAAQIQDPS